MASRPCTLKRSTTKHRSSPESMEMYIRRETHKHMHSTRMGIFDMLVMRSKKQKLEELFHYKYCVRNNINNVKFNGRYPFKRVLGATEFFSALFSLGNLLSNVLSYMHFLGPVVQRGNLFRLNRVYLAVNILTWAFSAMFHVNDTTLTRNLDYFCGFLNICVSFYLTATRILLSIASTKAAAYTRVVLVCVAVLYPAHCLYMAFVRFNFAVHKYLCGSLFVTLILGLLYLSLMYFPSAHAACLAVFALGFLLSAWVETLDFPPILYLLDSHACFHLITMVFTPFYYAFLRKDLALHNHW